MGETPITETFAIKTSHYVIGAMGLVAALSWDGTIKSLIHRAIPLPQDEATAQLLYSIIVTVGLILLIWILPDTTSELPAETRHHIQMNELKKHRKDFDSELANAKQQIVILNSELSKLQYARISVN